MKLVGRDFQREQLEVKDPPSLSDLRKSQCQAAAGGRQPAGARYSPEILYPEFVQ